MSDQQFDNFLKSKLDNHSSPVADDMWARINAARQKNRRVGYWWQNYKIILPAIIILLLMPGLYYFNSTTNDSLASKESKSLTEEPTSLQSTLEKNNDNNLKSKETENSINKNLNKEFQTKEEANSTGKYEKSSKEFLVKTTQKDEVAPRRNKSKLLARKNDPHGSDNSGFHAGSLYNKKAIVGNNSEEVFASTTTLKNNGEHKTSQATPSQVEEELNFSKTDVAPFIASAGKNILQEKSAKQELQHLSILPITDCPSAFGQHNEWFLEAFVSPDFAFKNTKGLDAEYVRRKDSTESFRSAFTAGFRINKTIGDRLMLKTGLEYSQINEKFNFRSENERKTITVITVRTIIRGPNDTLRISDTSTVEQIGYRVKTTYNRYRSLDIPVIVGIEWGNENFKTSVNTGLILNLQSWQQGDMLDTAYNPISFDKMGTQIFKKNIGLGIYTSVAFSKSIGNRTQIFAEPYFRYNISNMTNSGSPFNQRFHVGGINFGVRYKISGNRQH